MHGACEGIERAKVCSAATITRSAAQQEVLTGPADPQCDIAADALERRDQAARAGLHTRSNKPCHKVTVQDDHSMQMPLFVFQLEMLWIRLLLIKPRELQCFGLMKQESAGQHCCPTVVVVVVVVVPPSPQRTPWVLVHQPGAAAQICTPALLTGWPQCACM